MHFYPCCVKGIVDYVLSKIQSLENKKDDDSAIQLCAGSLVIVGEAMIFS